MAGMKIDFGVKLDGKVNLDQAGLSSVLTGPTVTGMVDEVAASVASGARALIPATSRFHKDSSAEIVVEKYVASGSLTGRRSAAKVVVKYPQAGGLQARYGILTKPVAALGLRVVKKRGSS